MSISTVNDHVEKLIIIFKRGAIEYGCVHSMLNCGELTVDISNERDIHLAHPWFLEGALHGSYYCLVKLIKVYAKFPPEPPGVLMAYWGKIFDKIKKQEIDSLKDFKNAMEWRCVTCGEKDIETLTLQQCSGCSLFCYCGQDCQKFHWDKENHKKGCKQLNILNKYHKPYAKEIGDAVIRCDIEIPALENLRYKLGLT